MSFDFTKLWDKTYLFGAPAVLVRSDKIFFGIAVGMVVLAIVAKIVVWHSESGRPKKFFMNRIFHLLFTIGLLLLMWYGARVEQIPWISAHFTALVVLVIFLVWLGFIARYYWRDYRNLERIWAEEKIKQKYLAR